MNKHTVIILDASGAEVSRHRDRSLFGCVFVKLSGYVANATAPQVPLLWSAQGNFDCTDTVSLRLLTAICILQTELSGTSRWTDSESCSFAAWSPNRPDVHDVSSWCVITMSSRLNCNCNLLPRHHAKGNDLLYSVIHATSPASCDRSAFAKRFQDLWSLCFNYEFWILSQFFSAEKVALGTLEAETLKRKVPDTVTSTSTLQTRNEDNKADRRNI